MMSRPETPGVRHLRRVSDFATHSVVPDPRKRRAERDGRACPREGREGCSLHRVWHREVHLPIKHPKRVPDTTEATCCRGSACSNGCSRRPCRVPRRRSSW